MLKLKRNEIYEEWTWTCDVGVERTTINTEFLNAVMNRLDDGNLSLAQMSVEPVEVGSGLFSRRNMQAVVARGPVGCSAIYVAMQFGVYATLGVYMTAPIKLVDFSDAYLNRYERLKAKIKNFDEVLAFNAFHGAALLALDQVVLELGLEDSNKMIKR